MTRREEKYLDALGRRVRILQTRVSDPHYRGDQGRQRLELAALRWALARLTKGDA